MGSRYGSAIFLSLLFCGAMLFGAPGEAEIYIYKDQSGNMVITDTAPGNVENMEVMETKGKQSAKSSGFRDIEKDLTEKYRPKSEIEKASLSAVTIKTSLGQGSGFFINEDGYILTNKHVLRLDETQMKKAEEFLAQADSSIEDAEAALADDEKRLRRMKSDLEDYKSSMDRMTDPNAQVIAMQNYRNQSAQYEFYEVQFRKRKNDFEEKKSKYQQGKRGFITAARAAEYDRQFIVLLKDKTEVRANLVSLSKNHDLALLRIERCRSPYLQTGAPDQMIQGMRVFAIGSPLGFGDSVSSGVLSGYDADYIRTDARIYPGNSGGALTTADGKVIGINTLVLRPDKFGGLGAAIPITRALQEFNKYLNIK